MATNVPLDLPCLYRRWMLCAHNLFRLSWHGDPRVFTAIGRSQQMSSWLGCVWASLVDSPAPEDAALLLAALRLAQEHPIHPDHTAEARDALTVRADELQAAGDERGEWLAVVLLPESEHCDGAQVKLIPAIAARMERRIEAWRKAEAKPPVYPLETFATDFDRKLGADRGDSPSRPVYALHVGDGDPTRGGFTYTYEGDPAPGQIAAAFNAQGGPMTFEVNAAGDGIDGYHLEGGVLISASAEPAADPNREPPPSAPPIGRGLARRLSRGRRGH